MTRPVKELCEWLDGGGCGSSPPSRAWLAGDWNAPLLLLAKLMAIELEQRRKSAISDSEDVTFKISFDSMLELAEDTLGIPVLITERDLIVRFPNVHLALLTYLICLRSSLERVDSKALRSAAPPRLIFEARNGADVQLPTCPACGEHVFIIDRVIVTRVVWHRTCFKCAECGKLLGARGAAKRTRNGDFECIQHAVRRILDALPAESSSASLGGGSGSGCVESSDGDSVGYAMVGGGPVPPRQLKSPRPPVAPPPRPKPKPPPKPRHLTSRPEPVYDTLEEPAQPAPQQQQEKTRSSPTGEQQRTRGGSTEEMAEQGGSGLVGDDEPAAAAAAPNEASGSVEPASPIYDNTQSTNPAVMELAGSPASVSMLPKKKSKDTPPKMSPPSDESGGSRCSSDSGVVLRMARMFSGEEPAASSSSPSTKRKEITSRASQPAVAPPPVPPPRPKRASMLITSAVLSPNGTNNPHSVYLDSSTTSSRTSTLSRPSVSPTPPPPPTRPRNRPLHIDEYPDYLCPFTEDDEDATSEYDESKNPFADSDDDSSKGPPIPAPRTQPPPLPELPGMSDRPKVQPPPPPPGGVRVESPIDGGSDSSSVGTCTPAPPKPARGNYVQPGGSSEPRIQTLRISRKKFRAPLPPVPQKRKINFTEHGTSEVDSAIIAKRLAEIEIAMGRIEVEGRAVEKEMLFQIATNPNTWVRCPRTDDWIVILNKKLDLTREQLQLLGLWREAFLNDVHSETEYAIRCLLDKDELEKTAWDVEREATLTNLLIYIIDEKIKLDAYLMDARPVDASSEGSVCSEGVGDKSKRKMKLRKRLSFLTKSLKKKREPANGHT